MHPIKSKYTVIRARFCPFLQFNFVTTLFRVHNKTVSHASPLTDSVVVAVVVIVVAAVESKMSAARRKLNN